MNESITLFLMLVNPIRCDTIQYDLIKLVGMYNMIHTCLPMRVIGSDLIDYC